MEIDEILSTQNLLLVMISKVHIKAEVKPTQEPLTLIILSDEEIQKTKHTIIGTLPLYDNDEELQDSKI